MNRGLSCCCGPYRSRLRAIRLVLECVILVLLTSQTYEYWHRDEATIRLRGLMLPNSVYALAVI